MNSVSCFAFVDRDEKQRSSVYIFFDDRPITMVAIVQSILEGLQVDCHVLEKFEIKVICSSFCKLSVKVPIMCMHSPLLGLSGE